MIQSIIHFFEHSIWHTHTFNNPLYRILRLLSIIYQGLIANKIPGLAAALSYYSLMSLGPIIAIMIMISGFVIQDNSHTLATEALNKVIAFIAPPVTDLTQPTTQTLTLNPELVNLLNHLVAKSRSEAVGIVGTILLIIISIQLIITIENALNSIWGTRRGRPIFQRLTSYWALLSLGAIIGLASFTLLSASTIQPLIDQLPFSHNLSFFIHKNTWLPIYSFTLVTTILALFYRYIPYTTVYWKPAIFGGILATSLLWLNNYCSFIYINKVISAQSLYGSIGIILVFMFGLYIFWLIILTGGQITYAIQNTNVLTHIRAWSNISQHTREQLCLSALIIIARAFKQCLQAPSTLDISQLIHVPTHALNECLVTLTELNFIHPIESEEKGNPVIRYQPAKPLEKITLYQVYTALNTLGNNYGTELIQYQDTILETYKHIYTPTGCPQSFHKPLQELL